MPLGVVTGNDDLKLFEEAGLSAAGGILTGDLVYYKPSARSVNTVMVSWDGTNWTEAGSIAELVKRSFKLPYGYWIYRNTGNGTFNFKHLRPW